MTPIIENIDPSLLVEQSIGQSVTQALGIIFFLALIGWITKLAFEDIE